MICFQMTDSDKSNEDYLFYIYPKIAGKWKWIWKTEWKTNKSTFEDSKIKEIVLEIHTYMKIDGD
jgi:hypothetical protein